MSTPIGEHDVCRHLEMKQKPAGYRRMDAIPLSPRVNARHILEGLRHQVGDLRNALVIDDLNADGAVVDVERMIRTLKGIKRTLEAK